MSSEVFREGPVQSVAPALWRVINGNHAEEPRAVPVSQQLDQKFQEGKQRGMAEALAVARKESEAQVQTVIEKLAKAIADLAEARQRVREETAGELVRLSIAVAARILHREVTLDPDAIHGLLKAAFDKVQARESVRVFVNPSHEASVQRFIERSATARKVEIVGDVSLKPGDVRIETAQAQLDASIETQLGEIERGLADRLSN